ncbi:receptor-like protein 12 [Tanacetum coccineum]
MSLKGTRYIIASLLDLNLSNSGFSGQIPGEFSQLTSLQSLDLSLFSSYGSSLTTLVNSLTRLRYLYLDNNLTVMNLAACNLNGKFPKKVLQLQSLQNLDLALNKRLLHLIFPLTDCFEV